MSWYLSVLKKYAVFSGRSQRKEYWMFALGNGVIVVGLMVVGMISSSSETMLGVLGLLIVIFAFGVTMTSRV